MPTTLSERILDALARRSEPERAAALAAELRTTRPTVTTKLVALAKLGKVRLIGATHVARWQIANRAPRILPLGEALMQWRAA